MKSFVLAISFAVSLTAFNQVENTRTIDVGLEFRPRFEFRNGYKQLPSDSLKAAFFVSQRSRLSLDFEQNKMSFHVSVQDVRTWGQNGSSPATGNLGIFESYASFPLKEKWTINLGRQGVELDNGRLFSRANWNQYSRAHDGIILKYTKPKLSNELMLFYNQTGLPNFGTSYSLDSYKYLVVQYGVYEPNTKWTFQLLNAVDGYQSATNENVIYARGTSGGRVQFNGEKIGATVAAYYQYGQLASGKSVSAYYIQPEFSYTTKKFNTQLGMEYLSGNDATATTTIDHSFSTLYGVAFKFMGHMDYFTSFPTDVRGGGLINPYLFAEYKVSPKWRFKLESHAFFLQNNIYDLSSEIVDPFLGIELDAVIKYTIKKNLFFDFGFSIMRATASMGEIKTGDYTKTPLYSYLMLTWRPTLFHSVQKVN